MKQRKPRPKPHVRPTETAYDAICEAVSSGVAYGYYRAYKHEDKPTPDYVREEISRAVIAELCEALTWDGEP
jgi:hypothetical protein